MCVGRVAEAGYTDKAGIEIHLDYLMMNKRTVPLHIFDIGNNRTEIFDLIGQLRYYNITLHIWL